MAYCSRRDLIKTGSLCVAAALLPRSTGNAQAQRNDLRLRRIPRSGESIPCVGIGSYQTFDVSGHSPKAEVQEVLRLFHAQGGRLIDSSPMYGNAEAVIGEVSAELRPDPAFFMASKVWTSGRAAGIAQMEQTMRRMGTPRMFLMQVHNLVDVSTHLATLQEWKTAGRVKYVGVTHYTESAYPQLERAMETNRLDFVQVNYSMAERAAEKRLLPAAQSTGTAVIVNRPFAQASLFQATRGKALPPWATDLGAATWAQFFLKYILAHPAVTCVIPATRNPRHLVDNMGAGRGPLPDEKLRNRMLGELERS